MTRDKSLPSFRSIAGPLDVADSALDRVSDSLGVPTLVKPRTAVSRQDAAKLAAPLRAPLEKLTVELPAYLMDALKRQALDSHASVRHIVIKALKDAGFNVAAADLVPDARRTRGKRA